MSALIAAMSLGEKISGAGAVAAVVSFFMPWFSVAGTQTSLSGLDFGKSIGAVYLILLNAIAAATLCYLSSKAPASRKLLFAGYLVLIGAICGPANLLALIFRNRLLAAIARLLCRRGGRLDDDPKLQQKDVLSRGERSRRTILQTSTGEAWGESCCVCAPGQGVRCSQKSIANWRTPCHSALYSLAGCLDSFS